MNTQQGRALRYILGFFRVIYGLSWFAVGCGLLTAFVMPFSREVRNDFCRVPISFVLNNSDTGFLIDGTMHDTVLERASGWLLIRNGPMLLSFVNLMAYLLIGAVLLYSLKKTIQIVERVRNGKVFFVENMADMRRIAFASLLLFFFLAVMRVVATLYVYGRIGSGSDVVMRLAGSGLDLDVGNLIFPLFLWALAEVFRSGIEMKTEQDLVI